VTDQRPTFLGAVGRFFFDPTDPTVLGFMRILTGLIVLYVHAAYTPDLREFFGPHAWWDQEAGNRQRREVASVAGPVVWKVPEPTLRSMDDVYQRRAAEVEYMRRLPLDPAARKAQFRYLDRLVELTTPPRGTRDTGGYSQVYLSGLYFINSVVRLDSAQKAHVRTLLAAEQADDTHSPIHFPDFLRTLPPPDRVNLWDDALAFAQTLPDDNDKIEYVLHWFGNYPMQYRHQLVQFLTGEFKVDGKDMSLPAKQNERDEVLDYMTTWGGDTRQAPSKGTPVFSYWYHITDPTTMYLVHAAFLVVCILFTVGLWTRVTSVLTWAGSLSYIHRGQLILFGQDTMQTLLLMYLMVAPCGATLSVDALRKRFRAARALLGSPAKPAPWATAALAGPQRSWLANFAIRLIQINFCFIYASSGTSKLKGSTWWEQSAPWLIFANPDFGLIRYPAYEWLLRLASESRLLIAVSAGMITVYTLMVELSLPFLVWTRLRPVAVALSAMLHFGIAVFMGLCVFGLFMFTLLLCYFPAKLIRDRVCVTPGMGKKLTVRYDSKDPKSVTAAARVRALDLAGQVTFVDQPGHGGGARLVGPDGKEHAGRELGRAALRELTLLRPVRFLAAVV
jgi:hypothetical protein